MAHHGDARFAESFYFGKDLHAALELDGLRARLEQHTGVGDRVLRRLVGVVGKIAHDQRPGLGAGHGGDMMPDLVQSHLRRVGITENDHAHRIAHENQRHTRFIKQPRRRIIVSRQRRNIFAARPGLGNPFGRDFFHD